MSVRVVLVRPNGRVTVAQQPPRRRVILADGTAPRVIIKAASRSAVVVARPTRTVIRQPGIQGPQGLQGPAGVGEPGPPGPPGTTTRIEFEVVAGFDLSGHRVVVPRAIDIHTVRYGQNTVASHAGRPMWLTLGAAMAGDTVTVVSHGLVEEPSWNWADGPVYLADTGLLTQTAPTPPGAAFLCAVGYAVDATSMFFDRSLAIALT